VSKILANLEKMVTKIYDDKQVGLFFQNSIEFVPNLMIFIFQNDVNKIQETVE
jgi:hypothetical protein